MEHFVKPKISISRFILTVSIIGSIIIYAASQLAKEHLNRWSEDTTMAKSEDATAAYQLDTTLVLEIRQQLSNWSSLRPPFIVLSSIGFIICGYTFLAHSNSTSYYTWSHISGNTVLYHSVPTNTPGKQSPPSWRRVVFFSGGMFSGLRDTITRFAAQKERMGRSLVFIHSENTSYGTSHKTFKDHAVVMEHPAPEKTQQIAQLTGSMGHSSQWRYNRSVFGTPPQSQLYRLPKQSTAFYLNAVSWALGFNYSI